MMADDIFYIKRSVLMGNMSYQDYVLGIDEIVKNSKSTYAFVFSKERGLVEREPAEVKWDAVEPRVKIVHDWLNRLNRIINIDGFKIAVEFEDMPKDQDYPVFCYQKRLDYHNIILMPDFEIVENNYFCTQMTRDEKSFVEKNNRAVFYGSTTGTNVLENRVCCNTINNIINDPSRRIDAAKYFSGKDDIIFKLPSVVQCDNDDTVNYLKSLEFTSCDPVDYKAQLENKFLISVDGNGATCSRVAISLLSNSVLLKYDSKWILFYHRLLRPYFNFIPILEHKDVEYILMDLPYSLDYYESISRNSSEIFYNVFNKINVDRYFAVALNELYSTFFGKGTLYYNNKVFLDNKSHLDIYAHFSNVGTLSLWPSYEVFCPDDEILESISIYPASDLFKWYDIYYQVMYEDGSESDLVMGGGWAGEAGKSKYMHGFRIFVNSSRCFSLFCSVYFSDGSIRKVSSGEWCYNLSSPIKMIKFYIEVI
jgi:hypothetical protein